ncbi:Proline-tRNA ligase [Acididesulfobacillus acetoxydans]|uniref:Proline--tRNA ligase n=1 Tax=Acididesulfobacillus acetoxydans TaxID=1561005 RepID=A0A8S0WQD2_9FIRM|nr:proline--tRNA ligase [Acididesulfobacillus acetoxydans]CAA7602544.1 Proline-tRNA ligase [Acididesulfobacillus acetoxydans]CEJ07310.1 Proline--tRNA ligase [Acididesulfobacillus acetoxydans]
MRVSQLFDPTLREVPAEAEVVSHRLMLRAGYIRKAAAGIYTHLPLGLRVLRKIEQIVREEMDAEGGQEVLLPIVQPAELWRESGRWEVYGPEMFRLRDRHEREFCLGPTHEELITELIRSEVRSYKQLPLLLYQIQNKYRDERRPRFGLMRGREFIMKDLYSFDRDEREAMVSYRKMYDAYARIFRRCGLKFRPVEADQGAIGGTGGSHEFMVLADSGEAAVVFCPKCDYAANVERAECLPRSVRTEAGGEERILVHTPGAKSIEALSTFLNLPKHRLLKALLYQGDEKVFLVLVRGDREVNEIKLNNALGGFIRLELAGPETVRRVLGAEAGFVGPVGIPDDLTVVADLEVPLLSQTVCGANKADYHYLNAVPERDFRLDKVFDLRMVEKGEACPKCGAPLEAARGIEVGQVFNLGTKYSKIMQATYLDETGEEKPCVMGCYGIGVTRTAAAAIEQNNDENGIIWPVAIAPYHCIIVPVGAKDAQVGETAEQLYWQMLGMGIEVVIDDRDERPGVKFKDADLVGYPLRVTVGSKALAQGQVELRARKTGATELVPVAEVAQKVQGIVQKALEH